MTVFLQACGAILLAVILVLILGSHSKEIGTLLVIGVCSMVAMAGINILRPVIDFIQNLEHLGGLDNTMVTALLKVTGIGILSEVVSLVCTDSGNASLGKAMQLLGTATILWLSLPLFSALVDLLQKIMGGL